MLSVIALLVQLSSIPTYGALSPLREVPFFKSTQSLFPSGSTTLEVLQKQQLQKNSFSEYAYRWNGAYYKKNELRPVLPVHLSEYVIDATTQKRWRVLEVGVDAVRAENPQTKTVKTFLTQQLLSDAYDTGYSLALKDTYLRVSAIDGAPILTTVPQGFRLKPQAFQNGFFKVRYRDYEGFISLSEVIGKYDLATMAFSAGRWHFIKNRQFDNLITSENLKISLNQVQRIITPDNRGIIASSTQKAPLWSQIEVFKNNLPNWAQSELKGHGAIWWKIPDEGHSENNGETVLIDKLIRQPISNVSFHPKNPLKAILSSNGVYMTDDGLHWKRLKQFDNYNGPVHYFNDQLIFIGNFRSTNGGKTFDNYIQSDRLAQAIQDQFGFLPRKLQVNKIETKAPFQIRIEIETGFRKIKMESPLFTQNWKAAKI